VIPTLVGPEDDSFNFWGPNEGKGGDDLFGTGGGESTTGGGAAPEPAPAPAPAPNDQVESIFDED